MSLSHLYQTPVHVQRPSKTSDELILKALEGKLRVPSHPLRCSLLKWVFVAPTCTKTIVRKPGCLSYPIPTRASLFSVVDSSLENPWKSIKNAESQSHTRPELESAFSGETQITSCAHESEQLWPGVQSV